MLFNQHIIQTGLQSQGSSVQINLHKQATTTKAAEGTPAHYNWDDCRITILDRFPSAAC